MKLPLWVFLPLTLCLSGCLAYCNGGPFLAGAARGDQDGMNESGELGRPLPPSCGDALPPLREAFDALRPNLAAKDEATRVAAVEGLRKLCTRAPEIYRNHCVGLFDGALRDPSREVRWRAAWALGRMKETSPALRGAASDPDPLVAVQSMEALGLAFDEAALPRIAESLGRGEAEVSAAARAALERATGRTFPDAASWKAYLDERARARERSAVPPPDTAPETS